ncbi:class I SAM-dependent methyltransferase [Burkholderiales bacterium]|nr:class I SAM-dependent methyltransferase [Burkholderiales bacterium]
MENSKFNSNHLDLGCGDAPRNPYGATELFGVDLTLGCREVDEHFKICNLVCEPIPFVDSYFDSVSGFDVIEHIPRQSVDHQNNVIINPFVTLMNEIHRVLKPGGLFYASTPAFPSPEAFQDPTHVNIITEGTHKYFCGDNPDARIYGFTGQFVAIEAQRIYPKYAQTAKRTLLNRIKNAHKKYMKGSISHVVWQLQAIK